MIVATAESDWKNDYGLKATCGILKMVASLANSFFCSESVETSDQASINNHHDLPAS
jgi:hypothetical protein